MDMYIIQQVFDLPFHNNNYPENTAMTPTATQLFSPIYYANEGFIPKFPEQIFHYTKLITTS